MERFTGDFPDSPGEHGMGTKSHSETGVTNAQSTANIQTESEGDFAKTVRGNLASPPTTGSTRKEHFYDLFWKNKHTTITLCCVFWSFGMCVAFLGPTLLDLGCKTSTVFATMSWVFFSQSLFILLGSAWGGYLLQKTDGE